MSRFLTLGRLVHYVTDDYECPAMIVGMAQFFDDEDDAKLQYGSRPSAKDITLSVHHPWSHVLREVDTEERVEVAMTTIVAAAIHDPTGGDAETWHWPDECSEGDHG